MARSKKNKKAAAAAKVENEDVNMYSNLATLAETEDDPATEVAKTGGKSKKKKHPSATPSDDGRDDEGPSSAHGASPKEEAVATPPVDAKSGTCDGGEKVLGVDHLEDGVPNDDEAVCDEDEAVYDEAVCDEDEAVYDEAVCDDDSDDDDSDAYYDDDDDDTDDADGNEVEEIAGTKYDTPCVNPHGMFVLDPFGSDRCTQALPEFVHPSVELVHPSTLPCLPPHAPGLRARHHACPVEETPSGFVDTFTTWRRKVGKRVTEQGWCKVRTFRNA